LSVATHTIILHVISKNIPGDTSEPLCEAQPSMVFSFSEKFSLVLKRQIRHCWQTCTEKHT